MAIVIVPDEAVLYQIKKMYMEGGITLEQYAGCLRRWRDRHDKR